MRKIFVYIFLASLGHASYAQIADTSQVLKEVIINLYPSQRPLFRSPASISTLGKLQMLQQPNYTLVPALNTLPGVRMEERSPGSYRLSVRGSLLRSPFGVRNIKIYLDEFPLTDAGGNTYLNLLDPGSVERVEILKGPDGSLFGANTGGVALLGLAGSTVDTAGPVKVEGSAIGGSYGLFYERASIQKTWKNYQINFLQNFQRSDGYRENSGLKKLYMQTLHHLKYHPNHRLKLLAFYSDLEYETPGGLTLPAYQTSPRSARPNAITQQIKILNKTFYGGISNESIITHNLRFVITGFGSHTDFQNPFLTNYEVRNENTGGIRSYLELTTKATSNLLFKWTLGSEWQQTNSSINNFGNRQGTRDTAQALDNVNARQHFYFARVSSDVGNRLIIESAISLNYFNYQYKNVFPLQQPLFTKRAFTPQLMPRVAASYKLLESLVWRASVSRGYSPPTIAEIRPSDNLFYNNLQAESGWNYETGTRISTLNDRLWLDVAAFNFRLSNTIVRRLNNNGQEFFINAGNTRQPGIEAQINYKVVENAQSLFIKELVLTGSATYYRFTFSDYIVNQSDYSGKQLTGVPPFTFVTSISIKFPFNTSLFVQHNFTDRIPLNDLNTVFAPNYHLIQAKASVKLITKKTSGIEIFAGADNILNKKYSLGNDLNAFGNRFYNTASGRNFYGGINFNF